MKRNLVINTLLVLLTVAFISAKKTDENIINKKDGRIILAYKAFIEFLDTDKSWEQYKMKVLDKYPEVWVVHNKQLSWGSIDSVQFKKDLVKNKKEDFQRFLTQYSTDELNYLYDSIIGKAQTILPLRTKKQVDLCFFLPYGSCFVEPEETKNIIFISMWINPSEVQKIMAHEYSHILHIDRRPEENLTLKREIVSEGMAVYLTNLIIPEIKTSNSIPFMPEENFNWCMENEQLIKDSIRLELNDTTMNLFKRYISDGSWSNPPKGFVEKTAYFAGYRIIEACINKGTRLEDVCGMNAEEVIEQSGYFN